MLGGLTCLYVSWFADGVGQCVIEKHEDDQHNDGGGEGPPTPPTIRATNKGDDKVWDFVVLEFMSGGSLDTVLERKTQAWPWSDRLRALCDVAEGMAQMHEKRFVHRDLKPDNVLIDSQGRCKIADLGLARTHNEFNVEAIASLKQRRGDQLGRVHWSVVGGTPPCMSIFCSKALLHTTP